MKIRFSIFLLIFFVSTNINGNIARDSVENLVQLNNSQIKQVLGGFRAYGVQFFTNEDGIVTMQPFDEIFGSDGYNEISYFPSILSLLEKDPLQALSDMGINLNSSMSKPQMWKIIRDSDRTDTESYSWKAQNNQICYEKIGSAGWNCAYFYVGGKENNRKGYFSGTQSSDFYAKVDSLVAINRNEHYYSNYYDQYLDGFLNNNLVAEQKKLDAKNLPLIKLRDDKKAEQERIEEEKRKAEIAAEEKRIADLTAKSRISAQKNPGFRGLKPGLHYEDVIKICPLEKIQWGGDSDNGQNYSDWVRCYGINNIKFKAYYTDDLLDLLSLDMGPIVDSGVYLDIFGEGESNIYTKMKKSISDKYTLEYEYSERDRQLFNESEKSSLMHVYSKGQVALVISRKEKDYSNDLWLYINYRNPYQGEWFLDRNRPVRASEDDF
jgi:hypothetical protein